MQLSLRSDSLLRTVIVNHFLYTKWSILKTWMHHIKWTWYEIELRQFGRFYHHIFFLGGQECKLFSSTGNGGATLTEYHNACRCSDTCRLQTRIRIGVAGINIVGINVIQWWRIQPELRSSESESIKKLVSSTICPLNNSRVWETVETNRVANEYSLVDRLTR